MRLKISSILIFMIIFGLFLGCDKKELKEEDLLPKQAVSQKYTFFLKSTNKENITLTVDEKTLKAKEDNLKNKVILLDFWATWCAPCRASIPHLVNLKNRYKDKLEIIGVSVEQIDLKSLNEFIKKYNISYPVVIGSENFKISSFYGVRGIPYMVLYDSQGNLITDYTGPVPQEMIEQDIIKSFK